VPSDILDSTWRELGAESDAAERDFGKETRQTKEGEHEQTRERENGQTRDQPSRDYVTCFSDSLRSDHDERQEAGV